MQIQRRSIRVRYPMQIQCRSGRVQITYFSLSAWSITALHGHTVTLLTQCSDGEQDPHFVDPSDRERSPHYRSPPRTCCLDACGRRLAQLLRLEATQGAVRPCAALLVQVTGIPELRQGGGEGRGVYVADASQAVYDYGGRARTKREQGARPPYNHTCAEGAVDPGRKTSARAVGSRRSSSWWCPLSSLRPSTWGRWKRRRRRRRKRRRGKGRGR